MRHTQAIQHHQNSNVCAIDRSIKEKPHIHKTPGDGQTDIRAFKRLPF